MDQGNTVLLNMDMELLIKKRVNDEIEDAVIKMWLYHRFNTCSCGQL